jgi:hypothetical protein
MYKKLFLYTGNYVKIHLDKFCIFSKFDQNNKKNTSLKKNIRGKKSKEVS